MTAKPYVPVSWGDEPVFTDKLNQMGNNEQWLFENTPRMFYNGYGIKKPSGVKIMAAILVLPATKTRMVSGTFNFGAFFSAGSKPIVVTGTNPQGGGHAYSLTLRGVDSNTIDHRGFRADVYGVIGPNDPNRNYIHFIALGW